MQLAVSIQQNIISSQNESNSDIEKIIGEMSLLLMLNQVFKAKELCTSTIEEMKRKKEFDIVLNDLLNRN